MQQGLDRDDRYWLGTFGYCLLATIAFIFLFYVAVPSGSGLIGLGETAFFAFIGYPIFLLLSPVIINEMRYKARPASVSKKWHRLKIFLLLLLAQVVGLIILYFSLAVLYEFGYDPSSQIEPYQSKTEKIVPYVEGGSVYIKNIRQ